MRITDAARRAGLLTSAAASGPALLGAAVPLVRPPSSFADAVSAGCAVVALATWCWLAAAVVACVVAARRGASGAPAWTPRLARLLVTAAFGVALPVADAAADTADLLHGLPLPDRAVAVQLDPASTPGTTVVRPGDCLWSVAEDALPGVPTAARVDRAWRELYRLNRARVGPDPDLLRPGTRLALPRSLSPDAPRGDLR